MFYGSEQFKDFLYGKAVDRFIIVRSSLGAQRFLQRAVQLLFLRQVIHPFGIIHSPFRIDFFHFTEKLNFLRKLRVIQHIEGTFIPLHCLLHIAVGAVCILITVAEVAHRNPVALFGCGLKQSKRSALVLRYTCSLHEKGAEVVLGFPAAEIGAVFVQRSCLLQVFFDAAAVFIQQAEHPASEAVAGFCGLCGPAAAFFIVLRGIILVPGSRQQHIRGSQLRHCLGVIIICLCLIGGH